MIPVSLGGQAQLRCIHGPATVRLNALAVDSRLVQPGALFVPIPGRRHDGHDFIDEAVAAGAAAVTCAPGRGRRLGDVTVIEAEPLAALAAVASGVRSATSATVVAVAGSAGKTSTKDILAALCGPQLATVASPQSYNNEIGLPLTLAQLEHDTELVICELGTGASGELAALAAIAEPHIGVITAIGPEHLESFGSLESVAAAEAELIAALPAGATIVLPYGQPLLQPHRRSDLHEISFGNDPRADVHPNRWRANERQAELELSLFGNQLSLRTNLTAAYHQLNLAAALATSAALGLPTTETAKHASSITLSGWRGQERTLPGGATLINDAYNANPLSMQTAIHATAARRHGHRIVAILGEMSELGPAAPAWHTQIGATAAQAGIDTLIAIGPLARHYLNPAIPQRHWFPNPDTAANTLPRLLRPTDLVLLKGSRSAGLETLEPLLLSPHPHTEPPATGQPQRLASAGPSSS